MGATTSFVHLNVHSEYSLVDGLTRVKPLVKQVAELGMPAVAITDVANLFAMVKFYRAAREQGIKPLIGVELQLMPGAAGPGGRIMLLAQNDQGYGNLTKLVTQAHLDGKHQGQALIEADWLEGATDGLICLSGGVDCPLDLLQSDGESGGLIARLDRWRGLFPDRFYLELSRTGRGHEEACLAAAVDLALATDTPVVATNAVRFIGADEFEAHEARVCIQEGRTLGDPRRPRNFTDQQFLRSLDEMAELFSDLPEALENSVEIARRCSLEIRLGENFLPAFPVPDGEDESGYFRAQARRGLPDRLTRVRAQRPEFSDADVPLYEQRLELELDTIEDMGFPGYFLIVADFIRWAKENDVPVGPGRGSGAGSLVAYVLGITEVDPIEHELLFERFLNPERVSMPDFDIDFCMEGRDRVIDYVADRYGRDRVSQIITYGSMAARAVVRDVGRVLSMPYGQVDRIAKAVPFEIGMTLDKALEQDDDFGQLYETDDEARELIDLALRLEGLARNAGRHAGGVVIAPSVLTDFTPLYREQGGDGAVTQFDKDDVEAVGLVKFDFLGLRTLTIIDIAVKAIRRLDPARSGFTINDLPMDDQATFDLLKEAQTIGIFQLESRGMRDLVERLQPGIFNDVVALVALFRPGPLQSGMVDDFINRKHGRAKVDTLHPDLAEILNPTYGVIVYQEQVMQIAQVLAGYSLGQADLLRRAMGKKKLEEMEKQRVTFVEGAEKRGVDLKRAGFIFDLMEKFAGYGFNKSHSVAYALISYQTAWLKAHYPAAFLAAALSSDMDNTDRVVVLIDEARRMEIVIEPPSVDQCEYMFIASEEGTIRYGLGAVKGVGRAAIENIVEAREGQAYSSLFDFCLRIDLRKVTRRALDALIRAGALDHFQGHRAALMASLPGVLEAVTQTHRDASSGQNDLFGGVQEQVLPELQLVNVPEWSDEQRLHGERETLGLFLTGHPIDSYQEELKQFVDRRIADLQAEEHKKSRMAGLVTGIRTMNSKRGERIAFVTLEDRSGRIEIGLFGELYAQHKDSLVQDAVVVVEGSITLDEYGGRLRVRADKFFTVEQARDEYARSLSIELNAAEMATDFGETLAQVMEPFLSGGCPVILDYSNARAGTRMRLGPEWRVKPRNELLQRLTKLAGVQRVDVRYDRVPRS